MTPLRRPAAVLVLLCCQLAFGQVEQADAPAVERVVLTTIFGKIPIKLYSQDAPEMTKLIKELAVKGCTGCQFYRNEAKPWQGGGPPYALLQGVMEMSAVAPQENNIPVKFGHVCSIPGTKDFYIAYGDHPEWSAHSVWGEVENEWLAIDLTITQDYNIVKHPDHGTEMRMLTQPVKFSITAEAPAQAQ